MQFGSRVRWRCSVTGRAGLYLEALGKEEQALTLLERAGACGRTEVIHLLHLRTRCLSRSCSACLVVASWADESAGWEGYVGKLMGVHLRVLRQRIVSDAMPLRTARPGVEGAFTTPAIIKGESLTRSKIGPPVAPQTSPPGHV